MTVIDLFALLTIAFLTSLVSVVTGGTSLITVPALVHFGVEPRQALATNMLSLTCMSVGGTVPFLGTGAIDRRRVPLLSGYTLIGSLVGAWLVLVVPAHVMPRVIAVAMLGVAGFSLVPRAFGVAPVAEEPSRTATGVGYAVTFVLGVYGGFFSGGYVTLLTAAYVACFRMTWVQAISTTKMLNVVSSLVATLIFMGHGLVDYRLGGLLSVAMFLGAMLGARLVLRLPQQWVQRLFLAVVIALALHLLLGDVVRHWVN